MKKLFLLLVLLLPLISASSGFTIELKPHFYLHGNEVTIYNNDSQFDGISFDVVGKNNDIANRIINLTITKVSPDWKFNFPNNTETLISSQQKVLWKSEIIDTSKLNSSEPFFVIVGVSGKNEVSENVFYIEGKKEIFLNNPQNSAEDSDIAKNIGNWIWEGDYQLGLIIGACVILLLAFLWWRYRVGRKMERWRDKKQNEE